MVGIKWVVAHWMRNDAEFDSTNEQFSIAWCGNHKQLFLMCVIDIYTGRGELCVIFNQMEEKSSSQIHHVRLGYNNNNNKTIRNIGIQIDSRFLLFLLLFLLLQSPLDWNFVQHDWWQHKMIIIPAYFFVLLMSKYIPNQMNDQQKGSRHHQIIRSYWPPPSKYYYARHLNYNKQRDEIQKKKQSGKEKHFNGRIFLLLVTCLFFSRRQFNRTERVKKKWFKC